MKCEYLMSRKSFARRVYFCFVLHLQIVENIIGQPLMSTDVGYNYSTNGKSWFLKWEKEARMKCPGSELEKHRFEAVFLGMNLRSWARTFKCLWGSGIDSKEWIPPAYVAWRAGTIILFLLGSNSPHRLFKNSSSEVKSMVPGISWRSTGGKFLFLKWVCEAQVERYDIRSG